MGKIWKIGMALRSRYKLWNLLRWELSDADWRREFSPFLKQIPLGDIIAKASMVQLVRPNYQNGNVSPEESLAIAALVAWKKPVHSLEIGTFDGNTTLQIAANCAERGTVWTLDLPLDNKHIPDGVADADGQFILSTVRHEKRFINTSFASRVIEIFGDSKSFDFESVLKGTRLDLVFIDGSHSYEYVRSDTERIMPLLGPMAVIIWHDYCRNWPGVVRYLNELGQSYPLLHIAGTNLVFCAFENRKFRISK